MTIDLEVVGPAIHDVGEADTVGGRSNLVDQLSPDLRLTFSLFDLIGVVFLLGRARPSIEQHLPRQAHNFFAVRTDHQRGVQVETVTEAVARGS